MEAVKDMEIVIHVASPFPSGEPEDQQTVIKPAVDGTLNVLRACAATDSKVKRVVVTSSGINSKYLIIINIILKTESKRIGCFWL